MDDLIKEYSEILKNAQVGDFTYSGILAEFARKVIELEKSATSDN